MDEQMRNVNLSVNEINECLEKLIDDHGGEHFEPECPACTAFKKLAAALSQPAAQVGSSHSAGGECGGVQVHTTHKNVKTWPDRIWLQGNPDDDEPAPYSETWDNDTTWCADHIGESDIEYIRADLSGGRAS